MIPHVQKLKFGLLKQVSICVRIENKVNLLHEVGDDLVVHVVIDVHVHLSIVKMVPNDSPDPTT